MFLMQKTFKATGQLLLFVGICLGAGSVNAENRSAFYDTGERIQLSYSKKASNKKVLPFVGLSEQDVLDVDPTSEITEDDIQAAIRNARSSVSLPQGSNIVLVQSGMKIPDLALQNLMKQYFNISTYPGFPPQKPRIMRKNEPVVKPNSFIKNLRLVAARGRQSNIVVFWDEFQIGSKDQYSTAVIWQRFGGEDIPKDTVFLRYLIRVAVVDVASGQWSMYTPSLNQEYAFEYPSSRRKENLSIFEQIHAAKQDAYHSAVESLVDRYGSGPGARRTALAEWLCPPATVAQNEPLETLNTASRAKPLW